VDLLVRADAEQVQQVVELGAAMREAQQGMDGKQLRELAAQRRKLTSAVTARARELAAEHDVRVTDPIAEQVEATLTAAMIDPEAARAVRSGLLVGTLEATGFGPVDAASAVAAPDALGFEPLPDDGAPRRHLRAVPDLPDDGARGGKGGRGKAGAGKAKDAGEKGESRAEKKEREAREAAARALEEAREELADYEEDVSAAEQERDEAESEVARLEDEASAVEDEREELRRRLAELDDRSRHLDADLRGAVKVRKRAERFLADATRRRHEAAERVRELEQA
jgi:chromosome segregation ATPase